MVSAGVQRKEEVDACTWASLYQQVPVPEGGAYFEHEWIRPSKRTPARGNLNVYGASDYAVTGDGGDYTVHIVLGLDPDGNMHGLDLMRRQAHSAEWISAWCDLVKKWRPLEWVEGTGQIRASFGHMIDAAAREQRAYDPRRQFPTCGDKAVQAQLMRARTSMRGLYVPSDVPWRKDFEAELLRFPVGVHDDQADSLGLIGQVLDRARPGIVAKPKLEPAKATGCKTLRSGGGSSGV